mmetsp:Transcript_6327/g.13265  ORF Transcript_6327/g.13265 Transcript_6327/m.13265 type:complete len:583 (+) Transcript_6327:269-2017(+)|eukprot:CAMPEP_0194337320 /NCGR_PEP_ID=MMETSP0171-20130528/75929_1 /TAXON_ID=218684 /ORGANISM="Corethron pennatum, Strain L29A3" /LENGTH=582 /DNA_ID=CAMNT_0039101071 /DNA_START=159 /DNA_END=1907 /DNA_ORIENTATION=+
MSISVPSSEDSEYAQLVQLHFQFVAEDLAIRASVDAAAAAQIVSDEEYARSLHDGMAPRLSDTPVPVPLPPTFPPTWAATAPDADRRPSYVPDPHNAPVPVSLSPTAPPTWAAPAAPEGGVPENLLCLPVGRRRMGPERPSRAGAGRGNAGGRKSRKPRRVRIPGKLSAFFSARKCVACKMVVNGTYIFALDQYYHPGCFTCFGCGKVMNAQEKFTYVRSGGKKQPMHSSCHEELYGLKCCVCCRSISAATDGSLHYAKHPFFEEERMCVDHADRNAQRKARRCTGCHRYEPNGVETSAASSPREPFIDLDDAERCVCWSCFRTVIVDSEDARPVWTTVLNFLQKELGLPVWGSMKDIPILIVGHDTLNEQTGGQNGGHGESSQIMTRGLCLSEFNMRRARQISIPRLYFDEQRRSFRGELRPFDFQEPPLVENGRASITAILCLSGLPLELTASVLAHEATHAWIKLHPDFDVGGAAIPLIVEEGCAQLVANLFLAERINKTRTESDGDDGNGTAADEEEGPSDDRLRKYFKYCIEADTSEVYGNGFREAGKCYAEIGIKALLDFVVRHKRFPDVELPAVT